MARKKKDTIDEVNTEVQSGEVEIPALETVDVSEELAIPDKIEGLPTFGKIFDEIIVEETEEKQQENAKELIKELMKEAINDAIKALPKAKPLMEDLNEVAAQLAQEAKTVHHEWRSIYLRQQAELETILLAFSSLKHKLGFLSPDTCSADVIKRIQAEIFGVKE